MLWQRSCPVVALSLIVAFAVASWNAAYAEKKAKEVATQANAAKAKSRRFDFTYGCGNQRTAGWRDGTSLDPGARFERVPKSRAS